MMPKAWAELPLEIPSAGQTLPDAPDGQRQLPFRLRGSQAKTAFALRKNCEAMLAGHDRRELREFRHVDDSGNERVALHYVAPAPRNLDCAGFLTLTVGDYVCMKHGKQLPARDERGERTNLCPCCGFAMVFEQVREAAEANRRFNNINRHLLKDVFERAIVVTERHKSGAVHFHLVGLLTGRPDIRSGVNFKAIAKRDYRSAGEHLRGLWAMLREKLPLHGFGRAELLPIRSTGEAVACYVSKYVEKNLFNRTEDDRRKKLVRYLGWRHLASPEEQADFARRTGKVPKQIAEQIRPNDFSWGSRRACAWRAKARETASLIGVQSREECATAFGPRWAMKLSSAWQGRTVDDLSPRLVMDTGRRTDAGEKVVAPLDWQGKRLLANDLSKVVCPNWLAETERPSVSALDEQEAFEFCGRETESFRFRRVESPEFDAELAASVAGLMEFLKEQKKSALRASQSCSQN